MGKKKPTQTQASESIINQPEVAELANKKQPRKRKSQSPKALYRNLMIINEEQEDEKYLITYNSGNKKMKTKDDIIQKMDEAFHAFQESQKEESKYHIITGNEDKKMDKCESISIKFNKTPPPPLPPPTQTEPIPEIMVMNQDEGKEISVLELPVEEESQGLLVEVDPFKVPSTSLEKVVFNTPPASPPPLFPSELK